MRIYFVRHGQTEWNRMGKMQGHTDIALNEQGKAQARMTKEKLEGIRFDRVYCSPLTRAKETAQIIMEGWHLPLLEDVRLCERNFGVYEGNYTKNLDYYELWKYSDVPPFAGAEDSISFYRRVECFLDEIINDGDENILIVAHGGVSIPYYCYFHGYEQEDLSSVLLGNCEVSIMDGKKYNVEQRG